MNVHLRPGQIKGRFGGISAGNNQAETIQQDQAAAHIFHCKEHAAAFPEKCAGKNGRRGGIFRVDPENKWRQRGGGGVFAISITETLKKSLHMSLFQNSPVLQIQLPLRGLGVIRRKSWYVGPYPHRYFVNKRIVF
jgi:hypothetical protein